MANKPKTCNPFKLAYFIFFDLLFMIKMLNNNLDSAIICLACLVLPSVISEIVE